MSAAHMAGVDRLGGSYFGFCRDSLREWTGPLRRWRWTARRDARKHWGHL